jgi:SAM-dependent methyltransferase
MNHEFSEIRDEAARFWDEKVDRIHDPTFWMAHPACREAINARVTGSPHQWPLEWFKNTYCSEPFARGLSLGCGSAYFERAAVSGGIVRELDAYDVSPHSLEVARKDSAEVPGLTFHVGDFNNPKLPFRRYDIVLFHASLHHVAALERLFRRLVLALKPGGYVYVESEFVGPSRSEWNVERLALAQAVLDLLPANAKLSDFVPAPIQVDDPSEAIRSSEIPGFLRAFFDIIAWRPFGGQIVDLVLPYVSKAWADTPEGFRCIRAMLNLEDAQLRENPDNTHHLVAFGRLKSLPRLSLPLGSQALAAVRRRLSRYRRRG